MEAARVGYPSNRPMPTGDQESLGRVVVTTGEMLMETEKRLEGIIHKVRPMLQPSDTAKMAEVTNGVLNEANRVRNTATRIGNLVLELDNLL